MLASTLFLNRLFPIRIPATELLFSGRMRQLTSWPYRVLDLMQKNEPIELSMNRAGRIQLVTDDQQFRRSTRQAKQALPKTKFKNYLALAMAASFLVVATVHWSAPHSSPNLSKSSNPISKAEGDCLSQSAESGNLILESQVASVGLEFGNLAVIKVLSTCTQSSSTWQAIRRPGFGWILQKEIPPGKAARDF
jgi:hypothetical protein